MRFRPLSRFLLRAPLLPEERRPVVARQLLAHPLGATAVALASPDLASAVAAGRGGNLALDRYARRAAFRPTPHGLFAGVAIGRLGSRTAIRTGTPRAVMQPSWSRLARLGRALLDEPEIRPHVRLRRAPSLMRAGREIVWLAPGGADGTDSPFVEEARAELDARLEEVLGRCETWAPYESVSRVAAATEESEGDADEYLLVLVDDGLLAHDLEPPLVGPPPAEWMRDRLARLPRLPYVDAVRGSLDETSAALADGRIAPARQALARLPGGAGRTDIQAVLVFDSFRSAPARSARGRSAGVMPDGLPGMLPGGLPILDRAAVERAAGLAPVLFRLQDVMAPPAAERALADGIADCLDAVTEVFGAGALDLPALAAGDYGTLPASPDHDADSGFDDMEHETGAMPAPTARLLSTLVSRLLAAAAGGRQEAAFSSVELDALLPSAPVPPTFELFLAPTGGAGKPPGTGWVLGLHAPAGASWGRFAHALGPNMADALRELVACELSTRPDERRLDVVFAPSPDLAELGQHPPVRAAALALSGWPEGEALGPGDLELVADESALEPLKLRNKRDKGGSPVVPSPLSRARSFTAPVGLFRLLAGWSLFRQHAPWALALGPLANVEHLPRISVDGFVVSPASWRIPADVGTGKGRPRALARWRKTGRVPRLVQTGEGDELLLVDLDAPGADRDLQGQERVWEVVPAPGNGADQSGRRIEAVVAVVAEPEGEVERAAVALSAAATSAAGRVAPPRVAPAAPGWLTFKLHGAPDRQDRLLEGCVGPAVRAARTAGGVEAWHVIRYVEGPGRRHHLRLRVRLGPSQMGFSGSLEAALAPARKAGDLVTVETGPYHPETARFGEDAQPVVELIFESDSELLCALLDLSPVGSGNPDVLERVVRDFETIADAMGLSADERRALARRRRDAHGALLEPADLAAEYRMRQTALAATVGDGPAEERGRDPVASAFAEHRKRVEAACGALTPLRRREILPTLLHFSAVRLAGPNRAVEARAYVMWERALEGFIARSRRAGRR